MNEFVRIAQAGSSTGAQDEPSALGDTGTLTVTRPAAQQSIVMLRETGQLVDFRQILNDNISFIRIDGALQMVFADGGMVIIQDFFAGATGADALIIGDGQFLSIDGFVSLANLQVADEIQTAAGPTSNLATALGSPQGSGQTFEATTIGDLGDGLGFASLLQGEDPQPREFVTDDFIDGEVQSSPSIGSPVDSTLDEENLEEGTDPDNPVRVTASLDVLFGENPGNNLRLEFDSVPGGLTSDGVPLVSNISTNSDGGQTLTVRKDGTGEIIFTVTLEVVGSGSTASGQYTFEIFGNLDHVQAGQGESIPLVFGFRAFDSDGDFDSDTFTVNVIDDTPVPGESETQQLAEDNLPDGSDPTPSGLVVSGALNIEWGADNADVSADGAVQDVPGGTGNRSVVFAPVAGQPASTLAASSDGVALEYELSENHTVLTAYKGAGRLETDKVFVVSLSDDDTGSYEFELLGNIDHGAPLSQTDSVYDLDFAFVAQDGDGDAATGSFGVAILDDAAVTGDADAQSVSENNLENGTDPDADALTKSGDLNIVWGADNADSAADTDTQDVPGGAGNRSVVFAAIADQPTQATTSGGAPLQYVLSEGNTVLTALDANGEKVFEVTLSDDGSGSYTFTLLGSIDHDIPGSGERSETWNLDFNFFAVDGDQDATPGEFRVAVVDDVPLAGDAEQRTIQENDLANGTDPDPDALEKSGNLNLAWGADDADTADTGGVQDTPGAGTRSVVFAAIDDQPTQATTSDGVALEYVLSADSTILTAYKGAGRTEADKVFIVSLSDDETGSYTFELLGNVDHNPPGSNGQMVSWNLDFAFVASDSDGDTETGEFRVTVVDDEPVIGEPELGVVEEEELPGGLDDPYPFFLDGAANQEGAPLTDRFSGSLNIMWGADDNDLPDAMSGDLPLQDDISTADQRSVVFTDAADGLVADPDAILSVQDETGANIDLAALTSRGDALSYVLSENGTHLTAFANYGGAEERSVFRVALSDDESGSYTLIIDDVLDHPIQDTTPFDEDFLSLSFGFIARDSDGDGTSGTFDVLVLDDGPLFRTDDVFKIDGLAPSIFTETADLRIPEDGTSGTIFSTIEVPDGGTIQDINVSIEMQHGFSGDLEVYLIAPDGTQIQLIQVDGQRGGAVNGTVAFDDDASERIDTFDTNIVGTWLPADPNLNLDFLEGRDQAGLWILEVSDRLEGDTGELVSWTLEIQSGVSASVDEDDLSIARGDNVDGNGDVAAGDNDVITNDTLDDDTDPTTVFGNLGVLWGADNENDIENGGRSAGIGDRAVAFVEGDGGTIDRLLDMGLTSNGEALTYSLNATGDVLTASAGGRLIFTVELFDLDTGSFKFDLQDALDHGLGENENDIILNFLFVATDSDGDTGTSSFSVAVDDDLPTIGGAAENLTVSEGMAGPMSGNLGLSWGADVADAAADGATQDTPGGAGNRSVVFAPIAEQPTQTTTSDGVVLEYVLSANDTVLTAYKGAGRLDSDKVFEVSLSDDGTGAYTFELLGAIDHLDGQSETWDLNFAYVASDGDGDEVEGDFIVTITDSEPVIGNAEEVALFEENLAAGTDPNVGSLVKSGALGITWGADDTDAAADGATQDTPGGAGNRSVVFAPIAEQPTQATTSDGVALEYVLSANDTVLTAYKGAGRLDSDKVFEVSLSDDGTGAYTFELLGAIDHSGSQGETWDLDFAYVASDSDGDTVEGDILITVGDDEPVAGTAEEVALFEQNLAGGTDPDADSLVKSGALGITWGADDTDAAADGTTQDTPGGAGNRSVVFAPIADQPTQVTTSDGVALEYVLSANDTVLTAYKGAGRLESDKVYEVSLSDDGTGTYTFELLGTIDHLGSQGETWDLDFAYVASDSDGDTVEGAIQVTVGDDVPDAEIRVEDYVRIDETYGLHSDNVFDPGTGTYDPDVVALFVGVGTPGTDSDLPGPIYASYGVVGFDAEGGADGVADASLALRIDDTASGLTTTEGKAITLSLEDGLIVGRIDGNGDAAFAIAIDDEGNVSIVQYLSLRHPDATTSDEHITLSGKISAVLTVTDEDGDIVTRDVSIGDDVTFDDDGPTAFRRGSGLTGSEADFVSGPVAGQLQFDGGADGATVTGISFVSNGDYIRTVDPDASGPARRGDLSAQGMPLTWSTSTDANGVITAVAVLEGTAIKAFEIIVDPDGSYTYEQFVGLDHPDANEIGRADQLIFRMRFTVTDGDGDTDTNTAVIRIRDTGPEIGDTQDSFLEEGGVPVLSDVDLAIDWGADDANGQGGVPGERSVDFAEADAAANVSISDASGTVSELYSNGELVKFAFINGVLVGYTGSAVPGTAGDSSVVFAVVLSNEGSGSYDFVLLQPLDHAAPVGAEQFLDLSFAFTATDSDFDTSGEGNFTIRIDAAGSAAPRDYSSLTSDVFVNLSDQAQTYLGQTVSAETATDRDGVDPKIIGIDSTLGDDDATAGAGNDVLIGNDNANALKGNAGDDDLFGGAGNDSLSGGSGINLLDGGEGSDTADYSDNSEGIYAQMNFGWATDMSNTLTSRSDLLDGIADETIEHDDLVSVENLTGSDFDDFIVGDNNANVLSGGLGNDLIIGLGGSDTIFGGAGNDELYGWIDDGNKLAGGEDQDRLFGGFGSDEFVFAAGEGGNTAADADVVFFFQNGTDKLTITGGLTFADLTISDDASGNATIYDNVNNQYIAVINGVSSASLSASDFIFGSDPIVLDLDGDGVELLSVENGVAFDHNADGVSEKSGWAGSDDGILVVDVDGSGAIENGSEVFSEIFNGGSYANSLEALASLDDNGDNVIDDRDSRFGEIRVWQDANSDGVTQNGELKSLAELGIEAIGLEADDTYRDVSGNTVYADGTFTKSDGGTGSYAGVSFILDGEDQADADDTTRQSTAIAASVGLVLYAASTQEVAAGLSEVRIIAAPENAAISVAEDFTVTVIPASGFEGSGSVEFELVFADGSLVTRDVAFEVQADTSTVSQTQTQAESAGSATAPDNQADINSADPEPGISELAALVTGSVITGDDGDNVLVGTAGDDILIGGLGSDILTGGEGADTFVLTSLADADIITDYDFGQGDAIDLGDLLDGAFGPGDNANDYVRVQKQADGDVTLSVDLDGQGTGHDWQDAATLQGHTSMGESIRVVLDTEGTEAQIPVTVA
ncbi:DUF5801 repeats-in-toxin domain-containing protein [Roseibium sp.]|uniref:T1SS-143 repeat domain-containing protein n=1 Tax=Roseibium sp. TaxID=1936156 RepID=UPI003BABC98B